METAMVQHSILSANSKITSETIAGIDQHLVDHPLPPKEIVAASPESTIAIVWHIARPIVLFLEGALFFNHTWHDALKTLVGALDALTSSDALPLQKVPNYFTGQQPSE